MNKEFFRRLTAAFLAALILFSCNPGMLTVFSTSSVTAGSPGIGVYNHVLTDSEEAPVVFRVTFYGYDAETDSLYQIPLSQSIEIGDYYLDRSGTIELPKNEGVNFKSSDAFMEFLEDNGVVFITIDYDTVRNSVNVMDSHGNPIAREKYKIYPSAAQTNIAAELEGYLDSYIIYAYTEDTDSWELFLSFEEENHEEIAELKTTRNSPVTVERTWVDRGVDRDTEGKTSAQLRDQFTVKVGTATQSVGEAYFELSTESSNHYVYEYYLAERTEDNAPIPYTVTTKLVDSDSHVNDPAYGTQLTADEEGVYHVTTYGLTSLEFTVEWLDAANGDAKGEADSDGFVAYLQDNFTLYDETGAAIPFAAESVTVTELADGSWKVEINDLRDISDEGTAKVYELRPNLEEGEDALPLVVDDGSGDAYLPEAENLGVNSSVHDIIYNGGTLNMLLAGTTSFEGTVSWRDEVEKEERIAARDAAQIVLWRYVDTGSENDIESSAQVQTISVPGGNNPDYPGDNDEFPFNLDGLDKYDAMGRRYVYYAKEKMLIGSTEDGNRYEMLYADLDDPQDYLLDGQTVYNKLAATSLFSVKATWIAAARQGGEAETVFVLQRRTADGEWEPVPDYGQKIDRNGNPVFEADGETPVMVSASEITISDFRAEEMSLLEYFPVVHNYDDEGNRYEYRVVQTTVKRKDANNGESWVSHSFDPVFTVGDDPAEISLGLDEYLVTAERNADDPFEYDFTYLLNGDIDIRMIKVWDDPEYVDHESDPVTFRIQYLPFNSRDYVVYTPEGQETPDIVVRQSDRWQKDVEVPRYDALGHELDYIVTEVVTPETRPGYYSTYQFEKDNVNSIYTYTVTNHPTGEVPVHYIGFRKEWVDDGELEFREPVVIKAQGDSAVGVEDGVYTEDQWKTLWENNAWQDYINTDESFAARFNANPSQYSSLFTEHMTNADEGKYWTIDEIRALAEKEGSELAEGKQWIYTLLSDRFTQTASNDKVYVQEQNFISFDNLVGVFKNDQHYYAVEQIWKDQNNTTMNGMSGEVVFRNIRLGVVSFKIKFDWNIGDETVHTVKVKITGHGNVGQVEKEYTITRESGLSGLDEYYILNLSKYDEYGKVIEYEIEEVELDGQVITDGVCTINGNQCVVSVEHNPTEYYNDAAHAHSDDLISVTLRNTFSNSASFTAHKRWHDNSGRYRTRSDLYIKLWRKSSAPGAAAESMGNEYRWVKSAEDTQNWWTYHFEGLEMYDPNGYLYTYYVTEAPINRYRTVYDNSSDEVEASLRSRTDAAYDGGTIDNYLYGEVVITGDKLWQNVPPGLTQDNYPVARVTLSAQHSGQAAQAVAQTEILNGDTKFYFRYDSANGQDAPHNHLINADLVLHSGGKVKTDSNGNLVLPKYDQEGVLIRYTLNEEIIKGYVFRISRQKIINDYTGGDPVQFTVHKNWNFNGANEIYPDVKVRLYQTFLGKDAQGNDATIVFNVYEARVTAPDWSYTFGVRENLRQYAPNGTEFDYYITEVLSNYDAEDEPIELGAGVNEGLGFVYTTDGREEGDPLEGYVTYKQEITNTYTPNNDNFMGKLRINKAWDNRDEKNESNAEEFGETKGYVFTLSRSTRKIANQTLFTVTTLDSYDGGAQPSVTPAPDSPITAADIASPSENDEQFVFEISLDDKTVTVTVSKSDNAVNIDGLAIFARDAVRYSYTVEEQHRDGYITPASISRRILNKTTPARYALKNVLDTMNLRLNKRFAAEDENGELRELDSTHFPQYFNEEYLKGLQFTLYRKTDSTAWSAYAVLSGAASEGDAITLTQDRTNHAYTCEFHDLPKYSGSGEQYEYRLAETKNGGEIAGQDKNLIKTQYRNAEDTDYSEAYAYPVSGDAPAEAVTHAVTLADCDETPAFTVRNIFPAKLVTLKKVWDDHNNVDGMRPGSLKYRVFELVSDPEDGDTEIKVDELLASGNDEEGWSKTVVLPQYYFNGGVVAGLQFRLDENLPQTTVDGESAELATDYTRQYNKLNNYRYTRVDAESDWEYGDIPESGVLRLTNHKDQVNGSITLTKTFPEEDPWGLQPDTVYVKLFRRCYFRDTNYWFDETIPTASYGYNYQLPNVTESPFNEYTLVLKDQNDEWIGDESGLITLTKDAAGNYSVTISNLPIGVNIDGSDTSNGRWLGYIYRFEECAADGTPYVRADASDYSDDSDPFSYKWVYTEGVNTNDARDGQHLAVETTGEDAYRTAHRDQGMENVLKTTSHSFEKIWEDENNDYETRRPITVQLQRRLATDDPNVEANWKPVNVLPASTPEGDGGDSATQPQSPDSAPASPASRGRAPMRGAGSAVARIGDRYYETLQEALNAGGNVVLLADIDLGSDAAIVPAGKTVVLDLNGKDITSTGFALINRGTLTVRDSSGTPGTVQGKYAVRPESGSVTNLKQGNYIAQECAVSTAKNDSGATINISGGTYTSIDNSVLSGNGSANSGGNTWNVSGGDFHGGITSTGYVACGIYAPNDDTWNLTGGTFEITNGAGIVQRAGTVNVGNGVVIETTGSAIGRVGDSRVVVPCAALVFDSEAGYPGLTDEDRMNVRGGSFTSETDAIQTVGTDVRFAVSGGTFSSPIPEEDCAEGYTPTANPDGTYGVETPYVARIGDQYYETLQEALNAGGSVVLLADIDLGSDAATVPAGKTVELDLNGRSITSTGFALINRGTLTVRDSSGTPGTVRGKYAVRPQSGSVTNLEAGNYVAQECAVSTAKNDSCATINISGGTYTSVDNSVLSGNGSANSGGNTWNVSGGDFHGGITSTGYVACGIYAPNDDTWNLTGGTFEITNGAGIVQRAGTVNVGSGVVIETTGSAIGRVGDSRVVVPCAALVFDSEAGYPGLTDEDRMNVRGGSFTSETDAIQTVGTDVRFAVSGGTFSSPIPEEDCAEGYTPTANPDGTYGVETPYVARIGDQYYETLQEALNAGGSVVLLADIDIGSDAATVPAGKTVVLDLNGRSITSTGFALINRGTLTVRDSSGTPGTVQGKYAVRPQSGSVTNLEAGNYVAQECAVSTAKNDSGATVNISGGTYTSIDNSVLSGNGSANSGGNTWNVSGGDFRGGITSPGYVACGIYAPNDDTWNLTGGTFEITNGAGIVQRAGTVNVGSGVVIETTGSAIGKVGDSRVVVPCSALVFDSEAAYPSLNDEDHLNVEGGSFTSETDAIHTVGENGYVSVSGGTFSSPVPPEDCAEDYIPKTVSGGVYSVERGATVTFVNEDGSQLAQIYVPEGEAVVYPGSTPVKAHDDTCVYVWTGWNDGSTDYAKGDALPDATTTDVTYTATYDAQEIVPNQWIGVDMAENASTASNAVQEAITTENTQTGVIGGLPMYDENGVPYVYRVRELKIGENEIFIGNYNGHDATKTFDYYVTYVDRAASESDPVVTEITNHLILYEPSQDYWAEKIWDDNGNQDFLRPESLTVYLVQKDETTNDIIRFEGVLNEANGWKFNWENYPGFSPEGHPYYYYVEEAEIPNYTKTFEERNTGETADGVKWEEKIFTNTHAQQENNMNADKVWLNEASEAEKKFRPDEIEFILCCAYTAYKYVSVDPDTGAQTDLTTDEAIAAAVAAGNSVQIVEDAANSYDGPVWYGSDRAEALLARYPDTAWEGDYSPDDPSVKLIPYSKTLRPVSDRTNDAQWRVISFSNLPVSVNTCGTALWNGRNSTVTYYVREVDPLGAYNPYLFGVHSADATEGDAESSRTNLTGATRTVTASNKLRKRSIPVTKAWEDNGYTEQDLHYDVDFTLTCTTDTADTSEFTYFETRTVSTSEERTDFSDLPIFDQDGTLLVYTLAEHVHVESGPAPERQSGYVRSDTPAYTEENGVQILTGVTVTNTLPVIHYAADKVWDDCNNQDGARPEQLNFTLTGVAEDETGVQKTCSDTSAAHAENSSLWHVDFGIQPMYNVNNEPYAYSVTEEAVGKLLAARGYTRYITEDGTDSDRDNFVIADSNDPDPGTIIEDTDDDGNPRKTFHFQNRYTPKNDRLKLEKTWDEDDGPTGCAAWTRPAQVEVKLQYRCGEGEPVDLSTALGSDPVKQLILAANPEYAFTRNVLATDEWQTVFTDLPLNINPTGTAVYNGTSQKITYSVVETPLNGYVTDDSATAELNGLEALDVLTVTNTLKVKTVQVKKKWVDDYAGNLAQHYDVHLTLTNTDPGVTYQAHETIEQEGDASLTETLSDAVSFTVPQYLANGSPAHYTVTEDASDRQYGYVTIYDANQSFDASAIGNNTVILVTNTLPLTEIAVSKTWDDENNRYSLRPASISVRLERRTVTNGGAAWADGETGWTSCGEAMTLQGEDWSRSFAALPKFSASNIPYEYRVIESSVNAYDTTYLTDDGEQTDPVVRQDNSGSANSNLSFGVKNTLITAPLTLVKIWDDNGFTGANLHYPVTFTVSPSDPDKLTLSATAFVLDGDNPATTVSGNQWSRTTTALPLYDKDGAPILYTVSEETTTQHWGYQQVGTTAQTQNGVHGENPTRYYDSYTITNKLPVTTVTVEKHWAGELEQYPKADAAVQFNLTRKVGSSPAETVLTNEPIPYEDGEDDAVCIEHLLAKDFNNVAYVYSVNEQTVTGYSSAVSSEAVSGGTRFTITNTPMTGEASFVKYDKTDYDRYSAHSDFVLKTLANAEFELHRVVEEDDRLITVTQNADGSYSMTGRTTTSGENTVLTSASDGAIVLKDLEPNTYYLEEINPPTGYQGSDQHFGFTVSVDAQNQIEVTYGANVTILTAGLDEGVSRNGVPNAENLSPLRLTKVDAIDETTPLQYAAYDLLRLKPYSYRDSAAQSDAAESYLSKALAALTEDNGPSSALWTYWERAGSYVTDSAGQIATEGKPFGVYVFYEVKSSVGYDRDFAHEDAASTNSTLQKIGPILLDETHSRHDDGVSGPYYDLTHLELRSKAYVKILKTDENGAPLKNAEFQLFRDGDTDPIATVTTDFDGLNAEAIELDPAVYGWDTVFYFVETTPPTGYSADNGGADGTQIRFVLTRALAEETLHVERANDARLKGAVALTKISAAETDSGAVHVGDPLGGAVFELYAKNGSDPIPVYAHATQASTYRVVLASDSASILASFDTSATLTRMTTAADGKLHVEGLDWGDYYLKEVDPPTGFRLPDVEADRKVFFSVGRTNCADEQQLTMKNEPLTAMLKLNKQIDDRNAAAWGEPTFLFRIRQTHRYNDDGSFVALAAANQTTLTKAITVRTPDETGYADSTGWFAIAPGTYEITEVKVARYVPAQDSQTVGSDGLVTAVSNSKVSAVLRVRPDGRAEVTFFNQLDNYEKQSHTDAVLNRFNGWKALEVADMDGLTLTTPLEDRRYSLTIPKSNLLPKRVKADGTTEAVTAYPKLAITTDETEITVQDNGNTITVSGYREDVAGSIYRLKAVYDQKLQTTFELRFAAEPLEGKIEKRVVFRNDVQNRSYFADGGKNGTYTLIFLRSGSNATVLHNGAPLADSSAAVIPTPVIDTPYAARFEFAKWTYEITTDAATTSGEAASNAALYTVIATVDENAEILVTAVLKEKD